MPMQLTSHFVAFIDVLGFSDMVRHDCESSDSPKYLDILYKAHNRASLIFGKDLDAGLIQFSDSVVFSRPFDLSEFSGFLSAIAEWQKGLLMDGLLCRGGVTFGKHFVKDRFMFSKGMIEAYQLESLQARYPRIVVSDNLLELANPTIDASKLQILHEEDGLAFVDYLVAKSPDETEALVSRVKALIEGTSTASASVQEKMRWLARYSDFKFESSLSVPPFKSPPCVALLGVE
ncbi:hypothetical protein [Thauera sp. Sel9]|uniref:hypothetical protein n=1 Tax=Thauera sp. Sel9 TaxID=2974299 RepID=UPI0021E1A2AA|nr:hypothetical protein [Thauera sp. Sel9]MCV2216943.1 hypothetical protein [Thauera sp. Sel9]